MKFLVDNQLPVALARFLQDMGVECIHVQDLGLATATDREIWSFADKDQRIVVSKDEDFLHLAMQVGNTTQFVWVRLGNCRKQTLLAAVGRIWPQIQDALQRGERVVELR